MGSENKKPRIFIDKRGNWFQDGIKITHHWTYLENNRNLNKDKDGRFFVDEGYGKIYVEVEDTPFVVKMVNKNEGKLYAVLNDETVEELNPDNIKICAENIPYTTVKDNRFKARFSSQAYYEFAKYIIQQDDEFFIDTQEGRIKLNRSDDLI